MDRYFLKISIMNPQFISIITFDRKIFEKSSIYINISLSNMQIVP